MKYEKLTDADIQRIGLACVQDGSSYYTSSLSREIELAIRYYNGELPEPSRHGSSRYVSLDVYDVVESLKAQLLETFSGNRIICSFSPQGPEDVEPCRIATEVCNYVYSRYNNGFQINQAVIHNGLMARNGIVKIYWNKEEKWTEEAFHDVPLDQLSVVLMDESVELSGDLEINQETGLASGKIKKTYDASNVKVEVVPPEEFIISNGATSKNTAEAIGSWTRKTKSELKAMGYPKAKIKNLSNAEEGSMTDQVKQARFGDLLDSNEPTPEQSQAQGYKIYEIYKELDKDGSGDLRLYRMVFGEASDTLFVCEEVDSIPYFSFTPLPVPHSFYGASFVDRAAHIQNAKTTITRGILEHTVITNNPRFWVLKGGLSNPRELIDNRVGGLVNVTRPDAFGAVEQAPLNPFAFQVIEKLDMDKEDNTGVSRLSKGMNKDAVSKQNAADMIADMTSLSMQRQKMIARNFAEGYLRDVFLYIHELVLKNAGQEYWAEVAGEYVPVDVKTWRERKDCVVEFTIGYQEDEKTFQQYMMLHQMLSADPAMAPLYGTDKKYGLWKKALHAKGIRDIDNILTRPEQAAPPQPDPVVMAQLELDKAKSQAAMAKEETARMSMQLEHQREMARLELEKLKLTQKATVDADRLELDRDKFEHDQKMDAFEKTIVQQKAESGELTASANVNSSTG